FHDSNNARLTFDGLQELHLLRSEIERGKDALSLFDYGSDGVTLPVRLVEVRSGRSRTTYALKTRIERALAIGQLSTGTRSVVKTNIRAFRSRANYTTFNGTARRSPIQKYGEKVLKKDTFAGFMYLSNTDISCNDDQVYFYGYDVIYGRIHSNTEIWLKNFGGWPTFHGFATTGETFMAASGAIPYDDVFLGGYDEEVGTVAFFPTADLIRQNGTEPIDNPGDILLVDFQGPSFVCYAGFIEDILPPDTLIVFNQFPPYGPVGDSIGYNVITFVDTLWSPPLGGSLTNGQSYWVDAELWVHGMIENKVTWGASGDIKLVDDLWYAGTPIGDSPDGFDNNGQQTGNVNDDDMLGLVSEGQIWISYGYVHPSDTLLRLKPNCDGIFIYAALCALGDGGGEGWEDGIFSFEYQYPHFSTHFVYDWMNTQEDFRYVDLHLGNYPPANPPYWPFPANGGGGMNYEAYPLSGGKRAPDYPWYNPIWPEQVPTKERGEIHLYGSVAQRRRGFVHRSGGDPLDTGHWDMENYWFGPPAWGVNGPGTSGGGVGYNKDYHYDHRFMENPPPDYPEVSVTSGKTPFRGIALRIISPPRHF
ncbi:MAG: hypothetical protein K8S56_00965, partial [Candidatus Cloacimonetes bacterium]|nr:hypothetical protein [Candidatus Cloacimonadota bacterium]